MAPSDQHTSGDNADASEGGMGAPPPPNQANRVASGLTRSYANDSIRVQWHASRCIHSAECVRAQPRVFNPGRRPWILVNAADAEAIAAAVMRCPTGALQFERLDGGPNEQPQERVEITVGRDGPYYVRGDVAISDETGTIIRRDSRVALCRCGFSRHKPYCDNSHRMTRLRLGTFEDVPTMQALIAESVRTLSRGFYDERQIESSLRYIFGVDSQLIADSSYYVIEDEKGVAAVGGWSRRVHLYGGDQTKIDEDALLDPRADAARIRAFFVAPRAARRGLASRIFHRCVLEAKSHGFTRLELVATMPGVPLYDALGFERVEEYSVQLADGVELPLVRMQIAI